jgi:predicted AlkP superfamily pyrophosphatase or phosphodiesterase
LLAGYADPDVNSNSREWNQNLTVLEFVTNQAGFEGKVAAFASWDVFPYIINSDRSGIPVNAGFEPVEGPGLTEREVLLNEMISQIPRPWQTVRHNAFTFHYAMEFLQKHQPRLLYLAFDETDEFAHSGDYENYLYSARQVDSFIAELWDYVQSDPAYMGKTTFLIATDHGRGTEPIDQWRHHGANIVGAEEVWLAVIGPDTSAGGEMMVSQQLYQNQIAATIAAFLGLDFTSDVQTGEVIYELMKSD